MFNCFIVVTRLPDKRADLNSEGLKRFYEFQTLNVQFEKRTSTQNANGWFWRGSRAAIFVRRIVWF